MNILDRVPSIHIIDSKVSRLNSIETVKIITNWVGTSQTNKYVCVCNTHSLVTAHKDKIFSKALDSANICTADGMPLVWALKLFGVKHQDRVDGPNLMLDLCNKASKQGYNIYLYGSTENTLLKVNMKLKQLYPNIKIVGSYSPPFRSLTEQENENICSKINEVNADLVFVSLGCPKQEKWMYENHLKINGVLLGVGAAFNFITGDIKRPPIIIQKMGLEWLFRLISEPKRLWKRYAFNNPMYIYLFVKTFFRNKNLNRLS